MSEEEKKAARSTPEALEDKAVVSKFYRFKRLGKEIEKRSFNDCAADCFLYILRALWASCFANGIRPSFTRDQFKEGIAKMCNKKLDQWFASSETRTEFRLDVLRTMAGLNLLQLLRLEFDGRGRITTVRTYYDCDVDSHFDSQQHRGQTTFEVFKNLTEYYYKRTKRVLCAAALDLIYLFEIHYDDRGIIESVCRFGFDVSGKATMTWVTQMSAEEELSLVWCLNLNRVDIADTSESASPKVKYIVNKLKCDIWYIFLQLRKMFAKKPLLKTGDTPPLYIDECTAALTQEMIRNHAKFVRYSSKSGVLDESYEWDQDQKRYRVKTKLGENYDDFYRTKQKWAIYGIHLFWAEQFANHNDFQTTLPRFENNFKNLYDNSLPICVEALKEFHIFRSGTRKADGFLPGYNYGKCHVDLPCDAQAPGDGCK